MINREQEEAIIAKLRKMKVAGPETGHLRLKNIIVIHEIRQGVKKSLLGFEGLQALPSEQILAAIAGITGCSRRMSETEGPGYIDARATLHGLTAAAAKIVQVCRAGGNVLLATGHPGAMIGFYLTLANRISKLGGHILTPAAGHSLRTYRCPNCQLHDVTEEIDYSGDVAVVTNGEMLLHTHDCEPMEHMLAALQRDGKTVDLVVADHGFAGTAIRWGVPVIAVMDTNDPAIAASRLLGYNPVIIPMDDNRPNYISAQVGEILADIIQANL